MTRLAFLLRTLLFHWRTNLAVWLGVVAGTAVIGGALIVGDSVRGSLREMTLARLGPVDFALAGPRFVRQELAGAIEAQATAGRRRAYPAILSAASLEKRAPDQT